MSRRLLKEYIGLMIENVMGTTGTGTNSTVSATTPALPNSKTDDSIKAIETKVEKNKEAMKSLSKASDEMALSQKASMQANKQTGTGLDNASRAAKTLSTTDTSDPEQEIKRQKAEEELSAGLNQSAEGFDQLIKSNDKTINVLSNLSTATNI